jgi:hypothetical protein
MHPSSKSNSSAPLLVANQDLMRRMEQISRKVAGTLQKKQDNSYNNSNDEGSLNKTEWIVVHLAREILQRHVRVKAMIAEGYLQTPAFPSTAQCETVSGSGSASNEKQDHWNPVFLSWDTLIGNWIRDGRLVPMMATMNDLHSCLQQQQQESQQHQAMDDARENDYNRESNVATELRSMCVSFKLATNDRVLNNFYQFHPR